MSDEPDPITAATPPIGVSSNQIFTIALALIALYALAGVAVIWKGTEAERTAYEQSTIGLATLAAGFYLGSSAGSRNKSDGR